MIDSEKEKSTKEQQIDDSTSTQVDEEKVSQKEVLAVVA